MSPDELVDGLRAWAAGAPPVEAAVELLARHGVWIRRVAADPNSFGRALDRNVGMAAQGMAAFRWHHLAEAGRETGASGGEHRVLRLACSLGGNTPAALADDLTGLDEANLRLALAAMAHANGRGEIFPFPEGAL